MYTAQEIIAKRQALWAEHKSIEQDRGFIEAVATEIVSESGEMLRGAIKAEPRLLIEMCFVIVDKGKQTVPFFLNDVQREFSDDLYRAEAEYRAGKRISINFLVLKGRQQGFTAYITAEQLARSIIQRNNSGFTVSNKAENTFTIFQDKGKFTYDHLPEVLKPTEKFNNRQELHFEKLNSRWRIATASKDIGISKTINFVHFSEAAFFEVLISQIQASLGDALTKDAVQIWESTANGYNEFRDAWDSGTFINKFFEWWRTKEYFIAFESGERAEWFHKNLAVDYGKKKYDVKQEEWVFKRCQWLQKAKGLSVQQLYWYYNKWDKYLDKALIKQQYPCSADEAFLASGRCVFDQEIIIERKEYLKRLYAEKPPRQGEFQFSWNDPDIKDKILSDKDHKIEFVENPNGIITIYETPERGTPYVIGGDTKGEGSDFFAATVIDNATGKRVATLHGNIDPDTYAHQLFCLGRYYNDALIGVEVNFDLYPIKELQRLQYPKQFKREIVDSKSKKKVEKLGFKTDGNTRPLIISNEIVLIRDNIENFTDIDFLTECLTFVYDDNGRPDAEGGKHDDLLFSDMIGEACRTQQSFKKLVDKKPLTGFYSDEELKDAGYNDFEIRKMR